jgi:hypothetical protein
MLYALVAILGNLKKNWRLFFKKKEFMKKLRNFFFLQNGKNAQQKIKSLI